ncbi:hypothetical protein C5167_029065 [Papaver somniferum]|nr:hypothetical protein C5167_029065 [Papaver somniferum]
MLIELPAGIRSLIIEAIIMQRFCPTKKVHSNSICELCGYGTLKLEEIEVLSFFFAKFNLVAVQPVLMYFKGITLTIGIWQKKFPLVHEGRQKISTSDLAFSCVKENIRCSMNDNTLQQNIGSYIMK